MVCTPFPTHRLASFAMQALRVDAELSPLVQRSYSLARPGEISADNSISSGVEDRNEDETNIELEANKDKTVLRTHYKAATNRMLRVAVNGFMESLALVIDVMENLDVDVLGPQLKKNVQLEDDG